MIWTCSLFYQTILMTAQDIFKHIERTQANNPSCYFLTLLIWCPKYMPYFTIHIPPSLDIMKIYTLTTKFRNILLIYPPVVKVFHIPWVMISSLFVNALCQHIEKHLQMRKGVCWDSDDMGKPWAENSKPQRWQIQTWGDLHQRMEWSWVEHHLLSPCHRRLCNQKTLSKRI